MSLFRALIVDDEQKICELIQNLGNWDALSIQVIGQCLNGADALERIRLEQPEIVITDIRMPVYDGLALVQKTKGLGVDTHFIIISGYRQFEYAHQAMQYGVADYLLKPIDGQELNQTLRKVCERLHQQAESRQADETLKQLLRDQNLRKRQELGDLLWNGRQLPETTQTCNERYGTSFTHDSYLVFFINASLPTLFEPEHAFLEKAEGLIQKYFQPIGISVPLHSARGLAVIVNFDGGRASLISGALSRLFGALRSLNDIFGAFDLCIGVGKTVHTLPEVTESFQAAAFCERSKVLSGWNRILYFNDVKCSLPPHPLISDRTLLALRNALQIRSIPEVTSWFRQWETDLRQENALHPLALYQARDQILRQLEPLNPDDRVVLDLTARTDRAGSLTTFLHLLSSGISTLLADLLDKKSEQQLAPIHEAREYMARYYAQPLTLEAVAEQVGLSPVYFSSLFKKSTGCNYIDYLTDLRIEAAKKLLISSRSGIQEIATQVGYPDAKYFMKLFKKLTGIKPGDYRKLYS